MHRFLLVASVIALAPTAAAGDCAPAELYASVITRANAEMPADGGIVVASTYVGNAARPGMKPDVVRPKWRLRSGTSVTTPVIDTIAPGLAVYRITATSQTAPVELLDDDKKVVATVAASKAKLAEYAAPKVKKLVYSATMSRHSSQSIEATLDAEPPAGTYAIVIADAKGKALSWGPVGKGAVQYPYSHSDCGVVPNGTVVPSPGELVTVFFVDANGRRSAASKPVKLTGKAMPGIE